jgi:receptor expression-enhancing protein 5/6
MSLDSLIKATKLDILDKNESLAFIEEKTKVKPSVFALALIVFLLVIIIISEASSFVIGIACFLVPGYFSFLALETWDKGDDKKYLTYWIVFSVTEVISPIFGLILTPTVLTVIRVLITIGLLHPQLNLSMKLYDEFISPVLMKHEKTIDNTLNDLTEKGKEKFTDVVQEGVKKLQ